MESEAAGFAGRGLVGTPVRRAVASQALVIVRPGWFTPADVGIVLAPGRQGRLVGRIRRADAGRLLRCCLRRHVVIIVDDGTEIHYRDRGRGRGISEAFWLRVRCSHLSAGDRAQRG